MLPRQLRRTAMGVALMAVAGAAVFTWIGGGLWSAAPSRAASAAVDVFPVPGARVAAPTTQITFRGIPAAQLGPVSVTGSKSGAHPGRVLADSDGHGGSFIPTTPFKDGERVTVTTGLNIAGGHAGSYSFTIATPAGRIRAVGFKPAPRVRNDVANFVSRPDLKPANLRVTRLPSKRAAPGGIFVAPQNGPIQAGPELVGPYGELVWFEPAPRGQSATDFRAQTYRGQRVLTWWQGVVSAAGVGSGEDEIYNSAYQPVATVRAGNGLNSDLHEFELTRENTALVTAYYPVWWQVGKRRRIVLDAVAQEIDVPTGLVLFQWDSLDHVPTSDSHQPAPGVVGHPWDYFHINSIQEDGGGHLIISSRDMWAVYKVSHQTGQILWSLGGKHSSFKMGRNTTFAFQHDARMRPGNTISIFDDGAGPPVVHKESRGLSLRLDIKHMTASVVRQDMHRPKLLAAYEGNVQRLPNGDDFLGWGQQPYATEYNSHGQMVFDARFVGANSSYRAYRFTWSATPAAPPDLAARVAHGRTTVYASWNGATRVARWRVLAGSAANALKPVASAPKRTFETAIRLAHREAFVAVQPLDSHGRTLSTSKTIKGS